MTTTATPPAAVTPRVLEALAARLDQAHLKWGEPIAPYTTFKIGGPADLFYEASSADALADAVLAVLRDPALATRWGRAGRRRTAARFRATRMAAETARLYEELLDASELVRARAHTIRASGGRRTRSIA